MNVAIQQRSREITERRNARRGRIAKLEKANEALYGAELMQLEKDCISAGGHHDNGGFMHGFCTDCGAYLG